jgi:hypothetical protein
MIVYRLESKHSKAVDAGEVIQVKAILEHVTIKNHKLSKPLLVQPTYKWNTAERQSRCVFYYSIYDGFEFKNFLTVKMIDHLKVDSSFYVIYNAVKESITSSEVQDIIEALNKWAPIQHQVILIVGDEIQKQFVHQLIYNTHSQLLRYLNIVVFNWFIVSIGRIKNQGKTTKKFSLMCRRHRPWRTYLIKQLFESGLLEKFHFSYIGVSNLEEITTEKIVQDLKNINIDTSVEFKNFLNNRPYYLGTHYANLYSTVPLDAVQSDIHLVIEHAKFDEEPDHEYPQFVSEKTYKAILAGKPFIALSTPRFLDAVRSLGYKTFSEWINESYDLETDPKNRVDMIVAEIARINALPESEYDELITNCNIIAEHNRKQAIKILNRNGLE